MDLSECEIYIMNVIWNKKNATSFDVLEKVKQDRKISENTVRTLLARMKKKNAITIRKKVGKTYIYEPLINRDDFQKMQLKKLQELVYENDINKIYVDLKK